MAKKKRRVNGVAIPVTGEEISTDERDADLASLDEGTEDTAPAERGESSLQEVAPSDDSASTEEPSSDTEDSGDSPAGLAEMKDKYLRALADLENYKKRAIKERSELLKYQGEKVLIDVIEVVDDFDRAFEHAEGNEVDPKEFRSGIELIHKSLVDILKRWEVEARSALGKEFDPNFQSAISRVPANDAKPGTVVSELKKAYFYKDKLIRVGEVVVAAELAAEAAAADAPSEINKAEANEAEANEAEAEETASETSSEPSDDESKGDKD